jgi:hypothetical protein
MRLEATHILTMSETDLEDFEPEDPVEFAVRLTVLCRPAESMDSEDAFEVLVCTPSWLASRFRTGSQVAPPGYPPYWSSDGLAMFGTGMLFVETWSASVVRAAVEGRVSLATGPDWGVVASRLGRTVPWEYDYVYDSFVDEHPGPAFPAE